MKDFATTVRHDVFAPTPSPVSVNRLLLYAVLYDLRVETGDVACPFMQADTSCEMFTRPLKSQEREGWIWRLHGAMIGMQTAIASVLTECIGFTRRKLERCLFVRVVSHVDDPSTCAKPVTLDKFWLHIAKLVVIKRARHSMLDNLWCAEVFKSPNAEDLI